MGHRDGTHGDVHHLLAHGDKQSGAHINPAVDTDFLAPRARSPRAVCRSFYVACAVRRRRRSGAAPCRSACARPRGLAHPAVHYVATDAGHRPGSVVAFVAEVVIAFGLDDSWCSSCPIHARLCTSSPGPMRRAHWSRPYITLGSAAVRHEHESRADVQPQRSPAMCGRLSGCTSRRRCLVCFRPQDYTQFKGATAVICAKLNHHTTRRCIFRCGYMGAALSR